MTSWDSRDNDDNELKLRLRDFKKELSLVELISDFLFLKRATYDLLVYSLWQIKRAERPIDEPLRLRLDWYKHNPYRIWRVTRGVNGDMKSWTIDDTGLNSLLPRATQQFYAPPTTQERQFIQTGRFTVESESPDGW